MLLARAPLFAQQVSYPQACLPTEGLSLTRLLSTAGAGDIEKLVRSAINFREDENRFSQGRCD